MKTLKDFDFKNKRVLVRCDFNVPLSEKGDRAKRTSSSSLFSLPSEPKILDDFRIKKTVPTIQYLLQKGAKIILMSHLGRPLKNRESKAKNQKFNLRPIAFRLEKLLKKRVKFLKDCLGEIVEREIRKMKPKDIVLLENLRFYKEEEENDKNFAKALSALGDIFINDAFSVCHRSHASVVGITRYLPSGAGSLLEKEIKILSQIIKKPEKPLIVIIGGKKVEDKAKLAEKFSAMADFLLVGNLVANKIKKRGIKIKYPQKFFFPIDNQVNRDIGKKTIKIFKEKIKKAKTIFWAGPLGKIEERKYQKGTKEIVRAIIESGAFSVVGGGDTIKFINKIGLVEKFNHVSTGGGAMLKFLTGEKLPGLVALQVWR